MNLGFGEIIVILLVVLLIFGAKRLPEVGRSIGKSFREFKKGVKEVKDEIDVDEEKDEDGKEKKE